MKKILICIAVLMLSSCTTNGDKHSGNEVLLTSHESIPVVLDTFFAYPIANHAIAYDIDFNRQAAEFIRIKLEGEFSNRGLNYHIIGNLRGLTMRPSINKKVFVSKNWHWENTLYNPISFDVDLDTTADLVQLKSELNELLMLASKGKLAKIDPTSGMEFSKSSGISLLLSELNQKYSSERVLLVRAHGVMSKGVRITSKGGLVDGRSARVQGSTRPIFITDVVLLKNPKLQVDWYRQSIETGHRNFTRGLDYSLRKLLQENVRD